jgi:hypothetical protein
MDAERERRGDIFDRDVVEVQIALRNLESERVEIGDGIVTMEEHIGLLRQAHENGDATEVVNCLVAIAASARYLATDSEDLAHEMIDGDFDEPQETQTQEC